MPAAPLPQPRPASPSQRLPSGPMLCTLSLWGILISGVTGEAGHVHEDALSTVRAALAERYEVEKEIGRGGMAFVWRARDLRHDRDVAIKLLYPELARAVGGERFLREIRILARLSHPHILPLLDSGTVEIMPGMLVPWYVMPFVAEETLRAKLAREGPLPVPVALRYTRELCSALTHAHAHGYIHRDIKPENILLPSDQAVLADFGIARAVTVASGTALSSTGLVVGTPAYMSPEQSLGSDKLDARSDIYSLGVVLYEMLAGHPPFTGATPQAISARHQFETPPPIGVVRPGLPAGVEAVVTKALAKVPADRYGTAAALDEAVLSSFDSRAKRIGHTVGRKWWSASALALTVAATGFLTVRAWLHRHPAVDPERYVVLPLITQAGASGLLDGIVAGRLLWEGLRSWTDLPVADQMVVASRLAPHSDPLTLPAAKEIARSLQAGKFIWGQVYGLGDSIAVRVTVYSTASGDVETPRSAGIMVARADLQAGESPTGSLVDAFRRLAQGLVVPELRAQSVLGFNGITRIATLRAVLSGDSALEHFDLGRAAQAYSEALATDSTSSTTRLRLARTALLMGNEDLGWRPAPDRIAGFLSALPTRERDEGEALLALDADHPDSACRGFRRMVEADSVAFFGWYGLGICQVQDRAVVPDSSSPSGWRFRSSYGAGIIAITRALRLASLSNATFGGYTIERLSDLLFAESDKLRQGIALTDSTLVFGAYPALLADTLAFIPFPIASVLNGDHLPPSRFMAVNSTRQLLLTTTSRWLEDYPQSVPVLIAHGLALEIAGALAGPAAEQGSALAIVDRLRLGRPTDISLAVWRVRLLVKLRRFREVRPLADSALLLPPRTAAEREMLAAVAGLIGQPIAAARQLGHEGTDWPLFDEDGLVLAAPPSLRAEAARLLAFAATGTALDSILAVASRLEDPARWGGQMTQTLRRAILFRPRLLAFPVLGPPPGPQLYARIEQALQRGDTTEARGKLDHLASFRAQAEPGTRAWSSVALEARLYLMLGDSGSARATLDDAAMNIARASRWISADVAEAAAVAQAILLYSQLLRASGDTAAQYWRDAATTLTASGN